MDTRTWEDTRLSHVTTYKTSTWQSEVVLSDKFSCTVLSDKDLVILVQQVIRAVGEKFWHWTAGNVLSMAKGRFKEQCNKHSDAANIILTSTYTPHMVHTRPPHCHHWHLSVCPTVAPTLVSRDRRSRQLSVARRRQLASRRRLLQIVRQPGASVLAQTDGNHSARHRACRDSCP